jgi:hypothetical protein
MSKSGDRRIILASPFKTNFLGSSHKPVSKLDALRHGRLSTLARDHRFDSCSFQLCKQGI